jgi:hypothetical protein
VLGEAGLAARDARPRPRQTEARRRHPAGGYPDRACEPAPWPIPPSPGRAVPRSRCGWHTARTALAQRAYVAQDPRRPAPCRINGVPGGPGMTLPNNRCRRIVVLRRRRRTFADVPGARRAVIGHELQAHGIATGHVRTGFRGSSGVSGAALTDHPSGTPGPKPQVNDPRGATDGLGRSRARGLFRAILMPRRDRASSPLASGRTPLCIGTWPCRHAAAESQSGLRYGVYGSELVGTGAMAWDQPRPIYGIFVAITVMNWTFASSGSLAIGDPATRIIPGEGDTMRTPPILTP